MTVEAPARVGDPFVAHVSETLVGARDGVGVEVTYKVVAIDPDGGEDVVVPPNTVSSSFGNWSGRNDAPYLPRQNGTFTFRLLQVSGGREIALVERRATTDKAFTLTSSLPAVDMPGSRLVVTGLR